MLNKYRAKFCFFCSDPCESKNSAICTICGALICIASHSGGAGCIGVHTIEIGKSFVCPVCIGSNKTDTTVTPYYLAGSGLRRIPKIAWPLLLLNIQQRNSESLIHKLVSLTMENNYICDPENVRFSP